MTKHATCITHFSACDCREARLAKLERVAEAARKMRDQYLPAKEIELVAFETLWTAVDAALADLDATEGGA